MLTQEDTTPPKPLSWKHCTNPCSPPGWFWIICSRLAASGFELFPCMLVAAILSILSNTILIVLKLIVGIMMQSVSVISEAVHSGLDLIAAVIAWFSVREAALTRNWLMPSPRNVKRNSLRSSLNSRKIRPR